MMRVWLLIRGQVEIMAIVRIPDQGREVTDVSEMQQILAPSGVVLEHWVPAHEVSEGASSEEILSAYSDEIERLKQSGGYITADVIDCQPNTPGLDAMLSKFSKEHWHDEDEVRFIVEGKGVFHLHPEGQSVLEVEVHPGDLLRVPRGILHWFNLCETKRIRCIRLFQDPSGWTPHYSESSIDEKYIPVCLGPAFIDAPSRIKTPLQS
ncbi:MAG: cupin domain-containing protein [Bdellovibrionales bacterium]|nr:cupin domain-containing protein [Bdellovibrionales bacterium]